VLPRLRVLRGNDLVEHDTICLFADRRRIFCYTFRSRTFALRSSTCSATARLTGHATVARPKMGEEKRNSTGGLYEIPTDDLGSSRAGRLGERNLAFRQLLWRWRLLPD